MSADCWRVCPKCKKKVDTKHTDESKRVETLYGKIPADEYLALRENVSRAPELQETLREDYSIHTNEAGEFSVDYHAICAKCGFEHEFSHKQQAA